MTMRTNRLNICMVGKSGGKLKHWKIKTAPSVITSSMMIKVVIFICLMIIMYSWSNSSALAWYFLHICKYATMTSLQRNGWAARWPHCCISTSKFHPLKNSHPGRRRKGFSFNMRRPSKGGRRRQIYQPWIYYSHKISPSSCVNLIWLNTHFGTLESQNLQYMI